MGGETGARAIQSYQVLVPNLFIHPSGKSRKKKKKEKRERESKENLIFVKFRLRKHFSNHLLFVSPNLFYTFTVLFPSNFIYSNTFPVSKYTHSGALWWHSGLRIQSGYYRGSGRCCGWCWTSRTSTCCQCSQKNPYIRVCIHTHTHIYIYTHTHTNAQN